MNSVQRKYNELSKRKNAAEYKRTQELMKRGLTDSSAYEQARTEVRKGLVKY